MAAAAVAAAKKYAVFGSTGECGKLFALYALEAGASLNLLVRDPKKLDATLSSASDRVTVVTGDVTNPSDVARVLTGGVNGVVSALGADYSDPSPIRAVGIKNICAAMNDAKVNRLIFIAGAGVLSPKSNPDTLIYQSATFPAAFKPLSELHQNAVLAAKAGGVQWTAVCPPTIAKGNGPNGRTAGKYLVSADHPAAVGNQKANAENIADFILNELTANQFVGKRVSVMEPPAPKPKPAADATATAATDSAAAKK